MVPILLISGLMCFACWISKFSYVSGGHQMYIPTVDQSRFWPCAFRTQKALELPPRKVSKGRKYFLVPAAKRPVSIHIIVSVYNENITWVQEACHTSLDSDTSNVTWFFYLKLENRSSADFQRELVMNWNARGCSFSRIVITRLSNCAGLEAHTFLFHISNKTGNFGEINVFLQGEKEATFDTILNGVSVLKTVTRYTDANRYNSSHPSLPASCFTYAFSELIDRGKICKFCFDPSLTYYLKKYYGTYLLVALS